MRSYIIENFLRGAYGVNNSYTKSEVDSKLDLKANSDNVYSISQVENLLYGKADKSDTYTKQEVNDKLNGYIKDNDTTYSATVRGKEVIVSAGEGYGSTTYKLNSIHTSNPRKPSCDYSFPNEKSGTLALTSDIPTVNNPTITFTQGGTTKGTITLNQSSDQTIALDAGGSGGGSNLLEALVDSNGNSRFIGGNGIPKNVSGMSIRYGKWSLNGSNLMFEILGTFSNSLSGENVMCTFTIPEWIVPKIQIAFNNIIDYIDCDITSTSGSVIKTRVQITISGNIIYFTNVLAQTINGLSLFKIRYNIIIDNE